MDVQRSPLTSKTLLVFSLLSFHYYVHVFSMLVKLIYIVHLLTGEKKKIITRVNKGKEKVKKKMELINMPECKYYLLS